MTGVLGQTKGVKHCAAGAFRVSRSMSWVLDEARASLKIERIEAAVHQALLGRGEAVPERPARDVEVVTDFRQMPPKIGFGRAEGRARLLHDLANIELQAMELAYRGLLEYPDAPAEFRDELAALTLSEASHLKLCLDGLEELGFAWGRWPVHLGLWSAVRTGEDLLDRVLIVHRYLEGSGLDAGGRLLERLDGLQLRDASWKAVETIHREEIGHVDFGSRWFRALSRLEKLDPESEFRVRMSRLRAQLPFRTEPLDHEVRRQAGFSDGELAFLEDWRRAGREPRG